MSSQYEASPVYLCYSPPHPAILLSSPQLTGQPENHRMDTTKPPKGQPFWALTPNSVGDIFLPQDRHWVSALFILVCSVLSVYAVVGTKWNQIEDRVAATGPWSRSRTLFNLFSPMLVIYNIQSSAWLGCWAAVHCVSSSAINSFSC